MSKRIRVILLEDMADLGVAGDIVTVSEGHARNALFPEGKAALASETTVARAAEQKKKQKAAEEQDLAERQKKADALDGTELALSARVKKDDSIFGTVTTAMIAKELQQQGHVQLAPKDIALPKKITKLGSYDVTLSFGSGVEATIKLIINPEDNGSKETDED